MTTIDMVTAALSGDKEGFKSAFDAAIGQKVTDALEVKKVEIASSLITPEVETNEIESVETEVDGSIESIDGTATEETNGN